MAGLFPSTYPNLSISHYTRDTPHPVPNPNLRRPQRHSISHPTRFSESLQVDDSIYPQRDHLECTLWQEPVYSGMQMKSLVNNLSRYKNRNSRRVLSEVFYWIAPEQTATTSKPALPTVPYNTLHGIKSSLSIYCLPLGLSPSVISVWVRNKTKAPRTDYDEIPITSLIGSHLFSSVRDTFQIGSVYKPTITLLLSQQQLQIQGFVARRHN